MVPGAVYFGRGTLEPAVGQPAAGDSPGQGGQGKIPRQGPLALDRIPPIGNPGGSSHGGNPPLYRRAGRRPLYIAAEGPGARIPRQLEPENSIQGQGFLIAVRANTGRASARR